MSFVTRHDVPGSELTTLQSGGLVATVIDAVTKDELVAALREYPDALCIGGGSNLVISDEGYNGVIIRAAAHDEVTLDETLVDVDATVDWDILVRNTVDFELQGLESTSGIPGTVGGAIVQNAGAYGQEISDVVVSVDVWDRESREMVTLSRDECGFAYRVSRFKHDTERRFIVLSARLEMAAEPETKARYGDVSELLFKRFDHEGPYPLEDVRNAVLDVRLSKGMIIGASDPSAGSFFTNPSLNEEQASALEAKGQTILRRTDGTISVSASRLLEGVGYRRGHAEGNVGLSEFHVLALVNKGGATTDELLTLAREARAKVFAEYGIALQPEPVMLGFSEYPFPSL